MATTLRFVFVLPQRIVEWKDLLNELSWIFRLFMLGRLIQDFQPRVVVGDKANLVSVSASNYVCTRSTYHGFRSV